MTELVKAIGDFVAAILGLAGFVGRPRQRTAIVDDLALLRKPEDYQAFGVGTPAHTWLTNHITIKIAEFSGLDLRSSRRAIAWPSVVVALVIALPLGWLSYHLVSVDHPWYATIPGIPAGLFFVAIIGLLMEKEDVIPPDDPTDGVEGEPETFAE